MAYKMMFRADLLLFKDHTRAQSQQLSSPKKQWSKKNLDQQTKTIPQLKNLFNMFKKGIVFKLSKNTLKLKLVHVRIKHRPEIDPDYLMLDKDYQSVVFKSLKKEKRSFLKHSISSYSFHFASILPNQMSL
jgi:hypothetical protein